MRRSNRGQAVTELTIGLLVLVPTLLTAVYLAEASALRLEATEAATEPLWDTTAYSQQSYTGGFVRTPGARAQAVGDAQGRMRGKSLLFTRASAPQVACGGAPGMGYAVNGSGAAYQENGGISCTARMNVGDKDLARNFLDQGSGGFFKEPLANLRRNFNFCENERCTPFRMSIGDWGMVDQGSEPEECHLTMTGCANGGFFAKAKAVYDAKPDYNGTTGRAHYEFMEDMIDRAPPPADFRRVTDFQMSYRGEESGFMEDVPVAEGEREWRTTPYFLSRYRSYQRRTSRYLGM